MVVYHEGKTHFMDDEVLYFGNDLDGQVSFDATDWVFNILAAGVSAKWKENSVTFLELNRTAIVHTTDATTETAWTFDIDTVTEGVGVYIKADALTSGKGLFIHTEGDTPTTGKVFHVAADRGGVDKDWLELIQNTSDADGCQFIIDGSNATGAWQRPSLRIGAAEDGWFPYEAGRLGLALNGLAIWNFSTSSIYMNSTGGPAMMYEDASATNPVWAYQGDYDTGWGRAAADQLSGIAGGVEGIRISESSPATSSHIALDFKGGTYGDDDAADGDYIAKFTATLNDTNAGGAEDFNGIWLDLTTTSVAGWGGSVYLMRLQEDSLDVFHVNATEMLLDNPGNTVDSPAIILRGDAGGTELEGQIQLKQGADPYIRISVDSDVPALTGVIDIHDTKIAFVNDNTCDIGANGANRPKDLYIAGSATLPTVTDGTATLTGGAWTGATYNGITIASGANTFSLTVGTGSLDIAAAKVLNIDENLTVTATCTLDQDLQQSASPTFNQVNATTLTDGTATITGGAITGATYNGITAASGANTFSLTVGTGSLDIAAGTTLNIDANLQCTAVCVLDQDVQQSASPTWNQVNATTFSDGTTSITGGAITGATYNGITLASGVNTFSLTAGTASLDIAAGATLDVDANLTVEAASVVNQDLTTDASPAFVNIDLSGFLDVVDVGAGNAAIKFVATSDGDPATWSAEAGIEVSEAPAGWIKIDVGGGNAYLPYWT